MSDPLIPGRDLPSLESLGAEAAQLLQQLNLLSQNGRTDGDFDPPPETTGSNASGHDWPPLKKTLEEEDEGRFGCSWPELDDKLRFHPNWEVRRDTLYYVRDHACKKDPRVMTTLKYMARRDGNVNVKLLAADVLVHVSIQTLPEQIWMLGHENWFERKNAINALEFAAEPEDDAVMTALSMSMSDASANVRSAAVQSLMNLARKRKNTEHHFPPFVLQQLLERLSDQDSRVRAAAAAGIVEVALPGDRDLVQDLAQKMQSRVTDIRRGASEVLRNLAIKFNETNDRRLRLENPEGSALVQIQDLMLHADPCVQRAALEAMQGISSSTAPLYTATDEVVSHNKADESRLRQLEHVSKNSTPAKFLPTAAATPASTAPATAATGATTGSRLPTSASAMSPRGDEVAPRTHAPNETQGLDLLHIADNTEEGDAEEEDVEEEEKQAKVQRRPQPRPPVLPLGFLKDLAATKSRGATAEPLLDGSSAF